MTKRTLNTKGMNTEGCLLKSSHKYQTKSGIFNYSLHVEARSLESYLKFLTRLTLAESVMVGLKEGLLTLPLVILPILILFLNVLVYIFLLVLMIILLFYRLIRTI